MSAQAYKFSGKKEQRSCNQEEKSQRKIVVIGLCATNIDRRFFNFNYDGEAYV